MGRTKERAGGPPGRDKRGGRAGLPRGVGAPARDVAEEVCPTVNGSARPFTSSEGEGERASASASARTDGRTLVLCLDGTGDAPVGEAPQCAADCRAGEPAEADAAEGGGAVDDDGLEPEDGVGRVGLDGGLRARAG